MSKTNIFLAMALGAIIAGAILAGAEPPRKFTYLQIACSQATYENPIFTNKMNTAWYHLTGDTNGVARELWAGWSSNFRRVADTNVTCFVYRNSLKNILGDRIDTTTPEVVSNVVAHIEAMPQTRGAVTRTPDAALAAWGIERKPSEGP
jgi:hypothetical protein